MKLTIKSLMLVIALLLFVGLFGCRLTSISVEEAKSNLEAAGYEVRLVEGSEWADSEENPYPTIMSTELDKYLEAKKDDEVIYMYFFYFTDDASNNYTFMNSKYTSGQNNNLVYFGTKQAIKDAGL